jgi:tRNA modification GTPase
MTVQRETICALATGAPPSAISVIRLSGPSVIDIAERVLSRGLPKPRFATLDKLIASSGAEIDTGLMVFMPGPASYTGEDTLELSLHGGRIVVELALKALMEAGARLAEPGEFTRRAFEAGKLDLTRAEAVADLIEAESESQHAQALKQMDGALAQTYDLWRHDLTDCLALLEASIDFPDEDDAPDRVDVPVSRKLADLKSSLSDALSQGNITERIRDGFHVVILGKPNAGKSTLLNRLARRDAAIVTEIPGTTRDIVEVRLVLGGYLVLLSDTAGIRDTEDFVEAEGVRRALAARDSADLRIWLFDASEGFTEADHFIDGDILVANKSDLYPDVIVSRETLKISAKTDADISILETKIIERLEHRQALVSAPLITRARHRQGIERGLNLIGKAESMLRAGYGSELIAEEVRLAARELGGLTGHVEVEAILGAVFSSFCIGK